MSFAAVAVGVGTAAVGIGTSMAAQGAQSDANNQARQLTQQGYSQGNNAISTGVSNANALLNPYASAGMGALNAFQGSLGISQPQPPSRDSFITRINPARQMQAQGQPVNPQIIAYFDQNPQTVFDEAGYNRAMSQYQNGLQSWQQNNAQSQQELSQINQYIKNASDPYTLERYKQSPIYTPFVNTLEDLQKTPGYQFRLNQGLQSVNNSAAANGSLLSGQTLQALNNYASDYASNEYQNAWQRAQSAYQNAFSNNQTSNVGGYNMTNQQRTQRLGYLNDLMGTGLNASNQQSNNIMQGAMTQAGLATGQGNAMSGLALNQGQNQANMYNNMSKAVNSGMASGMGFYLGMQNPNTYQQNPNQVMGGNSPWKN